MWPVTGVSCWPAIFCKLYLLPQSQPVENLAKVTFQQLFFSCPLSLSHPFHHPPPPPKKKRKTILFYPSFVSISIPLPFFLSLSLTATTFCNNEFVSEGRSEQRSWRRKKGKEKESERERNREKVRDKGADGMDAKNQQSHVRTIKINSFSLHSPHPSLSRLEGTQSVI